jgi:ABC-type transporter lipoprotein component MlaA
MPLKSEIMQNAKKQYGLKRKLLMQRQDSTSTETKLAEKQNKA